MPEPPSDFPDMESFAEPDMPEPEPDFGEAPDIEPDFGSIEQAEPDDASNAGNLQAVSISEDITATPATAPKETADKKEPDNNDNAISQQADFIPEDVPAISATLPEKETDSKESDKNESETEKIATAVTAATANSEAPEISDNSEPLDSTNNISR